jgi:hypothetical protein
MFHIVTLSEEIDLLIEALKKLMTADRHSAADKEKMRKILRLYNAANALKLIHRFLHRAHPNINGDLLPDVGDGAPRLIFPLIHELYLLEDVVF